MTEINVTLRDGAERTVEARDAISLMQNLRDGGVDEILALCGGCCSCATCHVHVDPNWFARLPARSRDEQDLLETSSHMTEFSRLSCQITVEPSLNGMRVTVAPED